eukprot:13626_2
MRLGLWITFKVWRDDFWTLKSESSNSPKKWGKVCSNALSTEWGFSRIANLIDEITTARVLADGLPNSCWRGSVRSYFSKMSFPRHSATIAFVPSSETSKRPRRSMICSICGST